MSTRSLFDHMFFFAAPFLVRRLDLPKTTSWSNASLAGLRTIRSPGAGWEQLSASAQKLTGNKWWFNGGLLWLIKQMVGHAFQDAMLEFGVLDLIWIYLTCNKKLRSWLSWADYHMEVLSVAIHHGICGVQKNNLSVTEISSKTE